MSNLFQAEASKDLVRIADQMEGVESGTPEYNSLKEQYKQACELAGITKNGKSTAGTHFSSAEIKASRAKALVQVREYLDDIRHWENELPTKQFGSVEYIAISHLANYKGMGCEINLEIPDSFYGRYSGYKCIKARKSLIMQHQLKGYPNIEYGLIDYGMGLCTNRKEKNAFYEKYAVPYNERLKQQKDG